MRKIKDLTILEVYNYYKMMKHKDKETLKGHLYEFYVDYDDGEKKLQDRFDELTNLQYIQSKQQLYTNLLINGRNKRYKPQSKEEKITLFSPPEMASKDVANILRSQLRTKSQITAVQDVIQAQEQMKNSRRLEREKRELERQQQIKECQDSIKSAKKTIDFDPTGSAFALYTGNQETIAPANINDSDSLNRSKGPIQYKPFRPETAVLNPGYSDNIHFKSSIRGTQQASAKYQQLYSQPNKYEENLNVQALTTQKNGHESQQMQGVWRSQILFNNLELLSSLRNRREMLKLEYQQQKNLLEQVTTNRCANAQKDKMSIIKYKYKVKSLQDRLSYLKNRVLILVPKFHDILNAIYTTQLNRFVLEQ